PARIWLQKSEDCAIRSSVAGSRSCPDGDKERGREKISIWNRCKPRGMRLSIFQGKIAYNPLKSPGSRKEKGLDFASPGFVFPSPKAWILLPLAWIFLP